MLTLIKKSVLTKYSWFLFQYGEFKVLGITNPIMDYLSPSFVIKYFDGFDKTFEISKFKINGKNVIESGEMIIVVDFRLFNLLNLFEQKLMLDHEVCHIVEGHLDLDDNIELEYRADQYALKALNDKCSLSGILATLLNTCLEYTLNRRKHLRSSGKWIKTNSFVNDQQLKDMIQKRIDRLI